MLDLSCGFVLCLPQYVLFTICIKPVDLPLPLKCEVSLLLCGLCNVSSGCHLEWN